MLGLAAQQRLRLRKLSCWQREGVGRRRGSRPPLGIISAASRTSVAVGLGEVRDGGERVRVPLAERLGKKGTCRGHVVDVSWTCRVRGVRVERRDASVELRAEQASASDSFEADRSGIASASRRA